jgi:hypothetical protein
MASIVAQTAASTETAREPSQEKAMPTAPSASPPSASTVHDFDFFVGRWTVRHRRLKERLAASTQWEEFGGTSLMQKLMDGQGNIDDNLIEVPSGHYRAVSLRSFDPKTRQWAIWWVDGRDPHHRLDPPMVGSFSAGIGTFYADEIFNERPIRVRYLWSDITANSCRWQQAFSPDGGQTWETNWIMDFERAR